MSRRDYRVETYKNSPLMCGNDFYVELVEAFMDVDVWDVPYVRDNYMVCGTMKQHQFIVYRLRKGIIKRADKIATVTLVDTENLAA